MWVLFTVATWPFWLLLFAFLCSELFIIERWEKAEYATLTTAGFIILVLLFSDWKPWHSITLGEVIVWGLGYLALGLGYAFPRWMVYVKDRAKGFEDAYKDLKARWDTGGNDTWNSNRAKYATFDEMLRADYKMPPMPWDKGVKGKIYMWMAYWPISGTWLLIHRPIQWFWDWAYATIKDKLAALSYAIFKSHFEGK